MITEINQIIVDCPYCKGSKKGCFNCNFQGKILSRTFKMDKYKEITEMIILEQ